ncbi:HupE/UreJ family protein [bacterium]|nr:HupE/UreJ family protein [bacterium]
MREARAQRGSRWRAAFSRRRLPFLAACLAAGVSLDLAAARAAAAHGLEPALLALRETSAGIYEVVWKSASQRLPGADVQPKLPEGCRVVSPIEVEDGGDRVRLRWSIDCGDGGLAGREIGVSDLDVAKITALVRVQGLDGTMRQGVLNESQPAWQVPARASWIGSAESFLRSGFRHALSGPEHVLLVAALLLLATDARALLALVAAFALGEGLALAPAALGASVLPAPAAALLVACGLLAIATVVARRERAGLARADGPVRALAFAAGLAQGAGFAGAPGAGGLPAAGAPAEWLGFQAGLLLAQAAIVALLLGLRLQFASLLARASLARRAAIWGLGVTAGYWLFERLAPWLG